MEVVNRDPVELAPGDRERYLALVRFATMAASSHNTQPWRFRLHPGRIDILPDLSRRLPVVDPDDHHLFASLGCAAENLLQAAAANGFRGDYRFDENCRVVRIALTPEAPVRSALFDAIPQRQCSRSDYDGSALDPDERRQLDGAAQGDGVSMMLIPDPARKEQVIEFVAEGNRAQLGDPAWVAELKAWVRFSKTEARRCGDGLHGPVMGNPSVPRWLGSLFMRLTLSARRQSEKDARQIRGSSAIAVFHSAEDDPRHWVEAGRSYQRFALLATALGLRTAFINPPVEVPALRRRFATMLGLGGRRPDLVVRVGRGPAMPRSMRRPLEQVLD